MAFSSPVRITLSVSLAIAVASLVIACVSAAVCCLVSFLFLFRVSLICFFVSSACCSASCSLTTISAVAIASTEGLSKLAISIVRTSSYGVRSSLQPLASTSGRSRAPL